MAGKGHGAAGRRSRADTDGGPDRRGGPAVGRATRPAPARDLLACAPHQASRGRTGPGLLLQASDLRERRREGREANLVLFVVDASGSMAARRRMEAVKGAVLSLLLDAYQRRDKVGLISFRGTRRAAAAAAHLVGGRRRPQAGGHAHRRADPAGRRPRRGARHAWPASGCATRGAGRCSSSSPTAATPGAATRLVAAARLRRDGVACVVVDCEAGPVRLGLAARPGASASARST